MYFSTKEIRLLTLYNILTNFIEFILKILSFFNIKIKKGVKGRKDVFTVLKTKVKREDKTIWFHCASLGEYEQGLPVFEGIRKIYPNHIVVLTFFSPSGYEIRKNAPIADVVTYLPLDTKKNAKQFLDLVNPDLAVFVKYEIWPNYLNRLKSNGVRSILISALFRENQVFFKPYGKWMLKTMKAFEHVFVQNEISMELLNTHNFKNVSISGDTRFDRVSNQLKVDNTLSFMDAFKGNSLCFVAGSSWPEGEKIISSFINQSSLNNIKYVIAPHNIKPKQIENLKTCLNKKVILYTEIDTQNLHDFDVLIVDAIGLLSKIYSYADIAYVGGAIGKTGLHNTLEPATFGVPIIIGKNYNKFPEASEMLRAGGLYSITDTEEFELTLSKLIQNETLRHNSGEANKAYIEKNRGAVIQIITYLRK